MYTYIYTHTHTLQAIFGQHAFQSHAEHFLDRAELLVRVVLSSSALRSEAITTYDKAF